MKNQPALLTAITLKAFIIITGLAFGFTSYTTCQGQSIVGKWKRTGTKIFIADKATGKQIPASAQMQQQYEAAIAARGYTELLELKSDNTYVSSVSTAGDAKPVTHNGTYALSGKDLDMKIPLVHNEKTTITIHSINANIMIWDHLFMGKLTEIVYTRM